MRESSRTSSARSAGFVVRQFWLPLALLMFVSSRTILAQQSPAQQPEGVLFGDIPVVTGASRFEQVADEAPASVTVITADEIARQGWRTLAEALQSVRGFYAAYDRSYTYIGVRGFGQPGDYNTRVLVLQDGQRLNENVGGGVFLANESLVELELVDRVEVIRGPGSSLYGASAFLAVVNVVTKRGRDLRGGEVAAAVQSFGGREGRVSLGTRSSSGVEILASGSVLRSTGQDLYFPEFDDPATHNGRATGVDHDQREHGLLKLTQGSLTLLTDYARREKQIPTGSYGTTFNDPAARTTDQSLIVALQYNRTARERDQVHAAISFNSYNNDGVYPSAGFRAASFLRGRWWLAEGNYALHLSRAHQVVVGGEYQVNTRQAQGLSDVVSGTVFFRDNTRSNNWGIFAQDEIRLSSRLLVNTGLRYDRYADFGGTLNPRLAIIYHHGGSAVKLLTGRAFRAPNNYEQFFNDGLSQKGNAALRPEEIWTSEIVVDRQLTRHWRLELSAYRNRIRRLITLVIDPADSLRVYENIGSVDARGIELETQGDMGGLDLRASYGLQQAHDRATGTSLPNSAHHLVKVNLSHALFRERVTVGGELQVVSRRTASDGGDVPGHAVLNITLRTQRWPAGLSAGVSVYNLFGARYGDPASPVDLQRAIPQDGRSLRATLQLGF